MSPQQDKEREREERRGATFRLKLIWQSWGQGQEGERNSCIKYDNVTQDEEAFVQCKSHQAHRREQEATGKKRERTTEGFYEEEKGERPRQILEPTETEKDAINVTKIE